MEKSQTISKLPEELRAKYEAQACECCDVVECLKVTAALKLWHNRGYRDIAFSAPVVCRKKTLFLDVLAKDEKGVVGVECMPSPNWGWLRERMAKLRRCLPPNSYLVIIFAATDSERVNKAVFLADEVWVANEDNSKVASMMFASVCHKG